VASVWVMLHMWVCCGSYDGLQGAGKRDYCAVATQCVSKWNPCWPGWRPAGGRGQCVYACHKALESSSDRWLHADHGTDGQTLPIFILGFFSHILAHIVKYRDTVWRELCENGWTIWDAVWNVESGGFREHVLHGNVDAPTGRDTWGVWPIEKHCKACDFRG